LQSRHAYAPCRTGDQGGFAGLHLSDAMNHLPRRHVIQDPGDRGSVGDMNKTSSMVSAEASRDSLP